MILINILYKFISFLYIFTNVLPYQDLPTTFININFNFPKPRFLQLRHLLSITEFPTLILKSQFFFSTKTSQAKNLFILKSLILKNILRNTFLIRVLPW